MIAVVHKNNNGTSVWMLGFNHSRVSMSVSHAKAKPIYKQKESEICGISGYTLYTSSDRTVFNWKCE